MGDENTAQNFGLLVNIFLEIGGQLLVNLQHSFACAHLFGITDCLAKPDLVICDVTNLLTSPAEKIETDC